MKHKVGDATAAKNAYSGDIFPRLGAIATSMDGERIFLQQEVGPLEPLPAVPKLPWWKAAS